MILKGDKIQNEYQIYKKFIVNSAKGGKVDINLMLSYIDSIDQRVSILKENQSLRLPLKSDVLADSIEEMLLMRHLSETEDHLLAST